MVFHCELDFEVKAIQAFTNQFEQFLPNIDQFHQILPTP